MTNPLIKQLSRSTDRRIRLRLRLIAISRWIQDRKRVFVLGIGAPLVAATVLVLAVFSPNYSGIAPRADIERIAFNVREAQAREIEKTETGIYHLKRVIREGYDKPAFVALTKGDVLPAPLRVDTIESWQHNDISLALVTSTAHEHAFRAYLAVPHNGEIGVHFFGEERNDTLPESRHAFDAAHDLGTLYTAFRTDERPSIPLIPDDAELVSISPLIFAFSPADSLLVHAQIDPETYLITQETIFVAHDTAHFEMTVIEYLDRAFLPAEAYDEIFTPERYPFTRISLAN